jgi:hypothetical protein
MNERRIWNLEFHCPQLNARWSANFSGEEVNRWPMTEKMFKLDNSLITECQGPWIISVTSTGNKQKGVLAHFSLQPYWYNLIPQDWQLTNNAHLFLLYLGWRVQEQGNDQCTVWLQLVPIYKLSGFHIFPGHVIFSLGYSIPRWCPEQWALIISMGKIPLGLPSCRRPCL